MNIDLSSAAELSNTTKDVLIEAIEAAIKNAATDTVQPRCLFRDLPEYKPEESEESFQKYAIGGYIFQDYPS